MAETLRDLVVSLSLDSDNFSRNIKSIHSQIKEAESEFRLAASGVDSFEKSVQGCESKLSMLQQKLQLQQKAVSQYESALSAAEKKLQSSYDKQQKLTDSLTSAKSRNEELKDKVKAATEQYERFRKELGEGDSATIAAKENLDALKEEYGESSKEVRKLEGQLTANEKAMRNNADAVTKASANLNTARANLRQTEAEITQTTERLTRMRSAWTSAGETLIAFGAKCASVAKTSEKLGKSLTATVTTPILALGTASAKAAIEFESAFAGVRKTVDATEEEYAQLESEIKRMSTEIATSTTDIAAVMEGAGQLGIAKENLVSFTRTMIDLGNSTDISADEAATAIAQFANVTGMSQDRFGNFGSTLVDLGNNFATTESSILNMASGLASAGSQVGLSEAQILGFATALSSVGLEAQAGGTAFSKAMIQMQVAVETGGDALTDFAKVSGMTEDAFAALWKTDPSKAIQSFIVGLSKMDEQGVSAIATLQDMGFTEVRLRDTLLRATNATELFANAQDMAARAWQENNALTNEASKRYATTESKLKNLKNTAVLAAQQIGADLAPTIEKLINGAKELVEKFMSLDEGTRMTIVKMAAVAAAAGPVILVFSKVTKGVGTVSTALGRFCTSVASAGGGMKGFLSVLGSSPSVWMAVAAAVVVATVALADYVSGAKEAREALKSMRETADDWKNTAADTFYGSSEGLSAFGMTKENFIRNTQNAQEWVDGLIGVWTDGQKETDEIVRTWTDSFKSLTASTRAELEELKAVADKAGYSGMSEQLQSDLDALDDMDAEIESLLKKRQNGLLTDTEKLRLQELIDSREAIEVKYRLTEADTDGFATIRQKVEAAVARAQSSGKTDADVSVYEDAVVAAAEGMAAINTSLAEQYDKEYALIQLMENEGERQIALDALNEKYNSDRRAAALEYAQTLSGVTMPVWNQESVQEAKTQVADVFSLLREYSAATEDDKPALLTELANLSDEMDEGALTEYLGLLTQIQSLMDNGMTETEVQELFPEIDVSAALDQFAGIADYLDLIKTGLPGLYSMFDESLPEEVLTIATDLNMEGAQARWNEFAANPGAITTEAVISGYTNGEGVEPPKPKTKVAITGYDLLAYARFTANNPVTVKGIVRVGEVFSSMEDVLGADNVKFFNENGVEIPTSLIPPEKLTADSIAVLDEDGTMHIMITPEVVGTSESVKEAEAALQTTEHQGSIGARWFGDTTLDDIKRLNEYLVGIDNEMNSWLNFGGWMNSWDRQAAESTLSNYLDLEEIAAIQTYVSEAIAAVNNGGTLDETTVANLESILRLVELMDSIGIGENVTAGIWQGMEEAGAEASAETVAENIENTLKAALGISSPSTRMKPLGAYTAEGVGVGMSETDLSPYASSMAHGLESALRSQLRTVGINAMGGLREGINSGTASVVAAMRSAARRAVLAAKSELKIASPSKVFRDEIGVMTMKGLGEGILKESKTQASIIRNASRYLTGEAKQGSIVPVNTDNRKTYNASSTISFEGANFYVNDAQDAYSLAVEIAGLTRRQQRGKGLRMA